MVAVRSISRRCAIRTPITAPEAVVLPLHYILDKCGFRRKKGDDFYITFATNTQVASFINFYLPFSDIIISEILLIVKYLIYHFFHAPFIWNRPKFTWCPTSMAPFIISFPATHPT